MKTGVLRCKRKMPKCSKLEKIDFFFKDSGDVKITVSLELSPEFRNQTDKSKKKDIPAALKRISCYLDPTVAS